MFKLSRKRQLEQQQNQSTALIDHYSADQMVNRLGIVKLTQPLILDMSLRSEVTGPRLLQSFKQSRIISANNQSIATLKQSQSKKRFWHKRHLIYTDILQLPFAENSVDFIFSNLMLHKEQHKRQILQEWQRILKPEGLLMFTMFGPDTLQEWRHVQAQLESSKSETQFIDMHDVGDQLVEVGFSDPVMDVEHVQLTYSSVTELCQALAGSKRQWGYDEACLTVLNGINQYGRIKPIYQQYQLSSLRYPITYEIVYAHAWGTETKLTQSASQEGVVNIPISAIKRGH